MTHDGAAAAAAGVDFLLRADRAPARLASRQYHVVDYATLTPGGRQTAP